MGGKGSVSQYPAIGTKHFINFTLYLSPLFSPSARFVSHDSEKATWTDARAACEMLDSELVIIDDKPEAEWVGHRCEPGLRAD